eukprot:178668-Rhodomonas_salina.4
MNTDCLVCCAVSEAMQQVNGYSKGVYQGFGSWDEAEDWLNSSIEYDDSERGYQPGESKNAKKRRYENQRRDLSPIPDCSSYGSPTITFGKHRGRSYAEIESSDPGYCNWVLGLPEAHDYQLAEFRRWLKGGDSTPTYGKRRRGG